jgi:Cd2+/Zn2+-exporting ATPase
MLQDAAVAKSRGNIEKLMDLRADRANVRREGAIVAVAPEAVDVGEVIVVRPGEKVALDGVLESGTGFLDTRALTGESAPRRVLAGDEVLSGSISLDGVLELKVSRPSGESTVSKILELVRHAAEKKSPTEKFITRFARVYTPGVVLLALLVAVIPPLTGFGSWQSWIYRALTFLIVSCPCALVLSIPLSFFGGIGGAARRGILVKGGSDLELLARIGTVAFDKTGTLTRGVFKVVAINPAPGVTEHDLLELAALAESQSNHPIARSVLAAYGQSVGEAPQVRELAGLGIEAASTRGAIAAGNAALMRKLGIEVAADAGSAVHVACDGRYCGRLLIADELKPGVREAVEALHQAGVGRIAMLTGDNPAAAALAAEAAGIKLVRAGLLPQDKIAELERLIATEAPGCKTAFVGDGINDAPVLARADLGIAMGGIGSDAAIEAADVVLMTDDPGKIPEAIAVARKTGRIVRENIALALGLKGAVLALAFFGFASAWFAIFADVGVALLAVANALRALR